MNRDLFGNLITEPEETRPPSFREWQIREGNILYRAGTQQMSTTHLLAHLVRNQKTAERIMERLAFAIK